MYRPELQRYRKGGRLILSKRDIENISVAVLKDFKPQALKEPVALHADEFIEQYLGFHLRYECLTNNESILGMVTFTGGNIYVYDRENDGIQEIYVDKNTVLIDVGLLGEDKIGRYEFTGFHEGGHCILHAPEISEGQMSMFEAPDTGTIICRSGETFYGMQKSDDDWREWQADYFSACMKLPRNMVRSVAIECMRNIGIVKDSISKYDKDVYNECCEFLPDMIAETFMTSKTAARYRLEELKIIRKDKDLFDYLNNDKKII